LSVYLIQYKSFRLLNDEIKNIINDSPNVTYIDYLTNDFSNIIEEASYFTLFNEVKYLIVKNADFFGSDKLKDNDNELLLAYLENPNPNTVLIFCISGKIDMRKVGAKKIKEKYTIKIIADLKPYEVSKRIDEYLKRKKYVYEKRVINYITSVCLNNYDLVCNELEKIDLYYNDTKNIDINDLEKIVSKVNEDNNFKLVDAVVSKNLSRAMKILDDLKIMKVEPTLLISLIAREYRIMYNSKVLMQSGQSNIEIGTLLGLQDWQVEKALKNSYEFTIRELEDTLLKLFDTDLNTKSGVGNKYLPLDLFILDI